MTKKKNNDESLVKYSYGILFILISIIGILHNYTGFLGGLFYHCLNFLFGYLAYALLVCGIIFGMCIILSKKYEALKLYISLVLIALATIILLAIPNNEITGKEVIDAFMQNEADNIFADLISSKAGLVGACLYGLLSALVSKVGSIIVSICFYIISIVLIILQFNIKFKNITIKKPLMGKNIDFEKKPIKLFDKIKKPKSKVEKKVIDVEKEVKQDRGTYQSYDEVTPDCLNNSSYQSPSVSYLDMVNLVKNNVNNKNAVEKWNILSDSLESFGLPSSLEKYNIGPSVTQFELVPEGNFNIRKYATIEENIKMDLAVKDIRIQAPIPGKKAVGIEIPNVEKTMVRLKELIQNMPSEYKDNPLTMCLGKDLSGKGVYASIDKMPHMLIAGATGTGKSVCINSIIMTLLYRAKPEDVKLLLIDPKKVEFQDYENIPHLICPIVTDTSKAARTLKTLVEEMDHRYDLFQQNNSRNISEYNNKASVKLCKIVVIIDELADLMALHGKEVEVYIQRLASMARASGIFMILATQRPSTDVITGLIKANISSRIAFAVSSSYDSRTILDQLGAESLFGQGDMLFSPSGASSPTRVQGTYVSEQEISRTVKYFKDSRYLPRYESDFIINDDDDQSNTDYNSSCNDPMYKDIKKWVITQQCISASGLQRRFSLGFPRAAKMIDALQQDGIISGPNGSKPRDVLVDYDPTDLSQE